MFDVLFLIADMTALLTSICWQVSDFKPTCEKGSGWWRLPLGSCRAEQIFTEFLKIVVLSRSKTLEFVPQPSISKQSYMPTYAKGYYGLAQNFKCFCHKLTSLKLQPMTS